MAAPHHRPLRRRDGDGLLVEQRRFFQALVDCGDPRQACEQSDISWSRFKTWLGRDRHFQAAFDSALGPSIDIVREMLETSAAKAAGVLDEALDSDQTMEHEASCPGCAMRFIVQVTIPNWAIRLRAGELILKGARVLKDVREFEGTVTHLNLEQRLALASFRANRPIPPNTLRELQRLGLISQDAQPMLSEGGLA